MPNGDTRGADSIKIEKLQRQLEAMRAQNRMLEGGQQGGEAEWLKEENQQLKARIAELMGTPGKPKAADGNRIRELEEEIATLRDQLRTAAGAR